MVFGIMRRKQTLLIGLSLVGACELTGPPRPDAIVIVASQDSIHFIRPLGGSSTDDTVRLRAIIRDSDGREYTGDSVTWSANTFEVGLIPTGPRTAKAFLGWPLESVRVEARLDSLVGSLALANCPVTQVAILRPAAMIAGRRQSMVAALFASGTVSGKTRWTSSDASVVELQDSMAVAVRPGSATLRAEYCRQRDSLTVTVLSDGYTVTSVDIPGAATYQLTNAGQVIALSPRAQATRYVWDRGTVISTYLNGCDPLSTNAQGQVLCAGNGPRIWENGQTLQRDTVTFQYGGQLTEAGHVFGGSPGSPFFVWRGPGDIVRSTCSPFTCSWGGAVNSRLDKLFGTGSYERPMLWRGSVNPATAIALGYTGRYGHATELNDSADVVGWSEFPGGHNKHAGRIWKRSNWSGSMLRPVNPWSSSPNSSASDPVDINNRGEVIGHGSEGPFVWWNGRFALLNHVLTDTTWSITAVIHINDSGQILARATNAVIGASGIVLLDPPASWVTLVASVRQ